MPQSTAPSNVYDSDDSDPERGEEEEEVIPTPSTRRVDWEVDSVSDPEKEEEDDGEETGEDESWMDFGLEEVDPTAAAAAAAPVATAPQRTREIPVRVMPPARWTTLQVASGKYGCNQGGALSMLMENHAHLLQLAFVSSLSFAGDVYETEASGGSQAEIQAKRDLVVPWHEYHAYFSAAADREGGDDQEGNLANSLQDTWDDCGHAS
jgi:hypothetical protein